MYESIWRIGGGALDREDRVEPIFELLPRIPGFTPDDYDLNQKEQWRDFDRRRTAVDALTQRTQLVRVRGDRQGVVAMVAMGKHGEQPTVVVRLPDAPPLAELVDLWDPVAAELDLEAALVTAESLRDAMEVEGIYWEETDLTPAMVVGWPRRRAPEWLESVRRGDEPFDAADPVSVESRELCEVLWLAPEGTIAGEAHRRALRRIGEISG